jgi:hypothetical protein
MTCWFAAARDAGGGAGAGVEASQTGAAYKAISGPNRTRDTLLVRLMGAGTALKRAIADVRALPPDAPERRLALPILVRLRLEIPADPAKQTTTDREFLMTTKDVDKYLEDLEEQGRERGRDEAFSKAVLVVYSARFRAPPAAVVAAVERVGDQAELQRLLEIVSTRSVEDVAAALRRPRAKPPARAKVSRRSASPRRAAAAR